MGRLVNIFSGEPEALGCVNRYGLNVVSSRLDAQGNYPSLGYKQLVGPDSGESRGLGLVQGVDVPASKGVVAAIEGQAAAFPLASFLPPPPGAKAPEGWQYGTGGVPAVAALVEDLNGDGVLEVLLARLDGFVNVLKLTDGSLIGLMSTGQPIIGMAVLKGQDGNPCLAVGTKFGVHVFAADQNGYQKIGSMALPVAAFAGPGGPQRDRVYVVDPAGRVTVLVLKSTDLSGRRVDRWPIGKIRGDDRLEASPTKGDRQASAFWPPPLGFQVFKIRVLQNGTRHVV